MIKIVRPDNTEYMSVEYTDCDGMVHFKNFSKYKLTITFDVKALPQLIPILIDINEKHLNTHKVKL